MLELSDWFKKISRPLPWRENHDPYRIWVSEIMLQQTQVETVIPYYHRFLEKFPTLASLAKSTEQEVLTLWAGLGYYRRAKNMRLGAQYLIKQEGKFPKTKIEMLEVPGIGPYTAGAILSIAFDLPVPLVDGNVQRVFARYFGIREAIQSSKAQKLFWQKAETWVAKAQSPRIHNQALMELGSLVCKKGTPLCEKCPLQSTCIAYKKNWQMELPLSKPRKPTQEVHWVSPIFCKRLKNGKTVYFIKQNINTAWWDGLWDFPSLNKPLDAQWTLASLLIREKFGEDIRISPLNHARHSVTHHRIQVAPFLVEGKSLDLSIEGKWLSLAQIETLPLSALAKKIFRQLPLC